MELKNVKTLSAFAVLFFGSATLNMNLWAQEAIVRGSVKDMAGNPIEAATMYFLLPEKGMEKQTKTDKKGSYYLRGLAHGMYEIKCVKEGYITVEDKMRFRLGVNQFDIVMQSKAEAEEKAQEEKGAKEYVAGYNAFLEKNFESAIESLKIVVQNMPENLNAYILLARSYFEIGEYDQAILNYKKVLETDKNNFGSLFDIGSVYVKKGDLNTAYEYFKRILELKPNDAEAHYNIGLIFFQNKEIERAIQEFRKAIELQADFALAHKNLAYALVNMNQIDDAITHFTRYIAISPEAEDVDQIRNIIKTLKKDSYPVVRSMTKSNFITSLLNVLKD